jgi:hypothetical protein
MQCGLFWQTPGAKGASVARQPGETIVVIALGERLGFESA